MSKKIKLNSNEMRYFWFALFKQEPNIIYCIMDLHKLNLFGHYQSVFNCSYVYRFRIWQLKHIQVDQLISDTQLPTI